MLEFSFKVDLRKEMNALDFIAAQDLRVGVAWRALGGPDGQVWRLPCNTGENTFMSFQWISQIQINPSIDYCWDMFPCPLKGFNRSNFFNWRSVREMVGSDLAGGIRGPRGGAHRAPPICRVHAQVQRLVQPDCIHSFGRADWPPPNERDNHLAHLRLQSLRRLPMWPAPPVHCAPHQKRAPGRDR